jgi:hypothetical protein
MNRRDPFGSLTLLVSTSVAATCWWLIRRQYRSNKAWRAGT